MRKNIIYTFGAVIIIVVFIFSGLEIALRLISPPNVFHPALLLRPRVKLKVSLNNVSRAGNYTTNSLGFRGDEPPTVGQGFYKIITIGGSTTLCFYLDDHKTWPYLLQENLGQKYPKTWVANGGLDGNTTRGHLIFMRHVVPKVKPDALIFLVGLNDLALSIDQERRRKGNIFETSNFKRWVWGHSRLIQVLYIWKAVIFDKADIVEARISEKKLELRPLKKKEGALPADLSALLPQLPEYRENIKKIIQLAKGSGIKTVFLTQPMLFEDNEFYRGVEPEFNWINNTGKALSAATYWRMLEVYNAELLNICREQNVACLDLAALIPHSDAYFYDAVHFNEAGARLVSEKVADYLISIKILNR